MDGMDGMDGMDRMDRMGRAVLPQAAFGSVPLFKDFGDLYLQS